MPGRIWLCLRFRLCEIRAALEMAATEKHFRRHVALKRQSGEFARLLAGAAK
jgi:hypothetical protein